MKAETIASVRAMEYALPLPTPLRLGNFEVRSREYVVVRIETMSGLVGTSWALSRGAPIAAFVERFVAPHLLGQSLYFSTGHVGAIGAAMTPIVYAGSGMRALSLADIALWDLRGQVAGLPVWALIGGCRTETRTLMVAGYMRPGDGVESVAAEVARFSQAGYELVKIASAVDDSTTRQLLESAVTQGLAARSALVVDAAWRWDSARAAQEAVSSWVDAAPIHWLEDPFRPERTDLFASLQKLMPSLPIGAGDEASDRVGLLRLVAQGSLDVLRVDLTTMGGFTGTLPLILAAQESGIAVSPHLYPEMNIHLAMAFPCIDHVETFDRAVPEGNPLDPMHLYISSEMPTSGSLVSAPTRPGLGAQIDIESLEVFRV